MHNSKTKSISTSSFSDESAKNVAETSSSADLAKIFPYPEVWKKAFTFGRNARFTRTPEVEILRRRIETDPIFAEQFKIFAEQKHKKLTRIPYYNKKTIHSQLTERMTDSSSVKNEEPFCSLTVLGQLPQQTISTQAEKNIEKHKLPVENMEERTKPTFYLSDDAFFECEPFILEQIDAKILEKDATSIKRKNNDVALDTVSTFDKSITAFYRVLEYRFPKLYDSITSESSTEDVQGIKKTSNVTCAKSYTHAVKETQVYNSEFDFEKTADTLSDVGATAVTDNSSNTTSIVENLEDVSVLRKKDKTSYTVSTRLGRGDSTFIPNFQSVDDKNYSNNYKFPPIDLLQEPIFHDGAIITQETLERSAGLLESVLEDFGIKGEIIHVHPGPVVTMYEFEPAAGVKSSRVISLSDDIARSMSAISTRVAVIPGRNVIGIELPNAVRETVYLRELIQSNSFRESQFKLSLALGKGINGKPVIAELAKMPHLLVAGTTGSGKSVAINTMILSILYRMTPKQCRLIMVDPKMLELSVYDGIPHLLTPVVTDPKKAVTALKWAVREMEERYRKMAKLGVRNIDGFNARVALAAQKGETIMCTVQSGFDKESGEMLYHEEAMDLTQLPYIVVIVDEMADLMMVAGKEIENAIQRLAQMARAAGIHLIMATQRPSVDVITGTIKANFPTRISFQVTSKIDSRTILGEQGAETLLGQGDMLHMAGGGRIVRVHGPFVSDEEVESVVAHLKIQGKPDYLATVTDSEEDNKDVESADSAAKISTIEGLDDDGDELYLQAVKIVMRDKKCSTSYIQRRLAIGYNKAASIVERMEEKGIVGAANHVGKREILLSEYSGKQDDFMAS
ncbi:DNA translocase FtsK [Bartonella sp. CB175]|uniref:DNA translocase FtsK n=1 Tax=Bartonella sp. CB175 TaxID=3112256 RepID=UPI00300E4362